jgi:hypothetical protein
MRKKRTIMVFGQLAARVAAILEQCPRAPLTPTALDRLGAETIARKTVLTAIERDAVEPDTVGGSKLKRELEVNTGGLLRGTEVS